MVKNLAIKMQILIEIDQTTLKNVDCNKNLN